MTLKRFTKLFVGLFFLIGVLITIWAFMSDSTSQLSFREEFIKDYNIYSLEVPDTLELCNQEVPLNKIWVKEAFDRELLINTYWQSQTIMFIKRSRKYFPVIEKKLKDAGMPEDLKYVPLIESGLMHVVSPAGAEGYWQFLAATARDYGLVVNSEIDERYDLAKSTDAAIKYFKEAHELFNDWPLAIASFNAGKRRIKNAVDDQGVDSYFELYLNSETSRYVYRVLAIKTIIENHEKFGFNIKEEDDYNMPELDSFKISGTVDIYNFCKENSVSYKEFRYFNPWLQTKSVTIPEGKELIVVIPKK